MAKECKIWEDLAYREYEKDPCPKPAMRSQQVKAILYQTPAHARASHPRLNPDWKARPPKTIYDVGIAAHALLVGGPRSLEILDFKDYKSKKAQELRDEAYDSGRTPLLEFRFESVTKMVERAEQQLLAHGCLAFTEGNAETSVGFKQYGAWCLTRPDWFLARADGNAGLIFDYKTTTNAHPAAFKKRCFDLGYDVQAELQCRGVAAACKIERRLVEFKWVVQEVDPPYMLSIIGLEPIDWDRAGAKVSIAQRLWSYAVDSDTWPGYPLRTCYITAPPWHDGEWMEIEQMHGLPQEDGS